MLQHDTITHHTVLSAGMQIAHPSTGSNNITRPPPHPNSGDAGWIPRKGHFAIPGTAPIFWHQPCAPKQMVQRVQLGRLWEKTFNASAEFVALARDYLETSPAEEARRLVSGVHEVKRYDELLLCRRLEENKQAFFLAF